MAYEQGCLLLKSILCGMVLLIGYDFLRTILSILFQKKMIYEICNMIFWMMAGVTFFLFAMRENMGELRGYYIAGWLTGMVVYERGKQFLLKKYRTHIQVLLKKRKKAVRIGKRKRWNDEKKEK